ncbi:bifunctional enoyl-CoA hydratase/phosphate acetyltransferase [Oleiagrimonas sp. C23AA]|uniref:bifunctional enoyl-CoA hydratase/phosphate acetyltransferase n=1 Tax=Oleiagrimonas sp. C23AA TaxID=2719047 RepID=UPI00141EB48E|nr:bifunctional enoyl-CoA hydratase/phosphate acetyltransferase [Oleiagrimonas sp. C23AA]NII09329.1 bifunctional enoyl-CoA hydratase/phosphate acetyltransferase [Oleiagrimonas sp. C23AA]
MSLVSTPAQPPAYIENRTFDEIAVGDSASVSRTVTRRDVELFAMISGDVNPAHLDADYARNDPFHHIVAHGMLEAGLISNVLGTQLPGPGTIYLSQDLKFVHPVGLGDTITATVTVTAREEKHGDLTLACRCVNQHGLPVITGTARVRAPREKIRRPRIELPELHLSRHRRYRALLAAAEELPAVATAIAHACDEHALRAAVDADAAGLIIPLLVGPRPAIEQAAKEAGLDISRFEIIHAEHAPDSARRAVQLVREGRAAMLMKGALHTDELLHAVLAHDSTLRTERRLSHVYLMDVPRYPRPLLVTDAAINIAPDLAAKRDIVQNAIDLAHVIGIGWPRVALLSAVETVNPQLSSTLDAAALCKMAERGQIHGAVLDGPLAFDNAVSPEAAADKGIISPVAGQADILLVPNLEAGNSLAKQLILLSGADAAGIVLGARVPIVLTSRADNERTRIASCAVGVMLAYRADRAPQAA